MLTAPIRVSELELIVADLQALAGQPLRNVWVPNASTVHLAFASASIVVSHWPIPRLHLATQRAKAPSKPLSFQGLLRARLTHTLSAIDCVDQERIVHFHFGPYVLTARLFHRGGGIWLCDDDGAIAAAHGPCTPTLPALHSTQVDLSPPRFSPHDGQSWALAAESFFQSLLVDYEIERARRTAQKQLTHDIAKLTRLRTHLKQDLHKVDRSALLRHEADLLSTVVHRLRQGMSEAIVDDAEHPEGTRHIALDPRQSPVEAMRRRYDTAKRLEAARSSILGRLAQTESRLSDHLGELSRVASMSLEEIRQRPPDRRRKALQDAKNVRDPWWTWIGPKDRSIRVGRHAKGNHALVFRKSNGRDWWLHLRGQPSAHVVIERSKGQAAPSLDLLLIASEILLQTAKVPHGESRDVQYARVSNVRSIKGAPPGTVQVTQERVLHVKRGTISLDGWAQTQD